MLTDIGIESEQELVSKHHYALIHKVQRCLSYKLWHNDNTNHHAGETTKEKKNYGRVPSPSIETVPLSIP